MGLGVQIQHFQSRDLIDPFEENEVLSRIVNGEKGLYALIIRKYNQRLYRIALAILNNESEVEDVVQATYIKTYENLTQFKFQSGFSTWITKILINESLMNLKKRRKIADNERKILSIAFDHKQQVQTPLMEVLNSELKIILESSIRDLPEKYRTVFVMREVENMSVSETTACLELSEANVKVRLNRAKLMLRDKLKDYIKQEELFQLYKPRCNRIVDHVMKKINEVGN